MNATTVTMVRIYITEGSKLLKPLIEYLHKDAHVRGISVFRAISGYGDSGEHNSSLIDLSLDLPLVIEFFDYPEKAQPAINHIATIIKSEHIVFWTAQSNN